MPLTEIQPGRVGNLTEVQTQKLKDMWIHVLKALNHGPPGLEKVNTLASIKSTDSSEKKGWFGRKKGEDLKHTHTDANAFKKALQGVTAQELRDGLLYMTRADNIDNLLLRFLRARKWDVTKALEMMGKAIHWRIKDFHVEKVLAEGEEHAVKTGDDGLILQYKLPKASVYGVDKLGRPIVHVHVRVHDPKAQSEKSIELYTVQVIETTRLMLNDPVDTANVIFDLTGFTLGNMDYAAVKFILHCFEAFYPESLGFILIHKAPWIFGTVWNVIKGWIDPVVAAKISFTKSEKDLLDAIEGKYVPKDLGGTREYEYKYIPVQEGENAAMEDTATRDKLVAERVQLLEDLGDLTAKWVQTSYADGKEVDVQRQQIINRISQQYWVLDPYVRARTIYDRDGTLEQFQPALANANAARNGAVNGNGIANGNGLVNGH